MSSLIRKNQSSRNFYASQTVQKFNVNPQIHTDFPNYEEWITSDQGKSLISTLKSENTILKEQLTHLKKYLKNVVSVFTELENENKTLRESMFKKESDLQKAVESLAVNQSLNEQDLLHQLNLYEEELKILSTHLFELKEKDADHQRVLNEKNFNLSKAKEYNTKMELNMQQSLTREKSLTNEYQIKQLQNEELKKQNEELHNQVAPLNEQVQLLKTENLNLKQKLVNNQELLQNLENDQKIKYSNVNQAYYASKSQVEKLQEEIAQLRVKLQTVQQQLDAECSQNYPLTINKLENQIQNQEKSINVLQSRLKYEQDREQQLLGDIESKNSQIQSISLELQTVKQEANKYQYEYVQLQKEQKLKTQKLSERIKSQYLEQIEQQQLEISKLENKIKEYQLLIENQSKELTKNEQKLQQFKQMQQEYENLKKQLIDARIVIQQNENKLENQQQNLNDKNLILKKQIQQLEDRYVTCSEQLRREQEKSEQLYQQNEQLKWYQNQYDDLMSKEQEFKSNENHTKMELNTFQTKINTLETSNQELKSQILLREVELKQQQQEIKVLNKRLSELESLKVENKLLREQIQNQKKYEQSTDNEDNESSRGAINIYKNGSPYRSPQSYKSHQNLHVPTQTHYNECEICRNAVRHTKTHKFLNPYRKI